MPAPRHRRRPDLNKLNPFDARDMDTINREWRRMQARKQRRANARGWVRVVLVIATYIALAWLIIGLVYGIAVLLLLMFG